jgi:undecaprenol kinase
MGNSNMKNQFFLKRIAYALEGVKASWQSESSFRLQVFATLLVILVLCFTQPVAIWWAILLLTCGLVLTLEVINTAIEKLMDLIHSDLHPIIKIVKDTLAGAVLLASFIAVCVFVAFIADQTGL